MAMGATVIIPARNEGRTIGDIVKVFDKHEETRGRVVVAIDADTKDDTYFQAISNGATAVYTDQRGKGQVVRCAYDFIMRYSTMMPRIILCDADYTGLTGLHVSDLLRHQRGMVIGMPDWPSCPIPEHVTRAWPQVSGFRAIPWALMPEDPHGYLLETQLNIAAAKLRMPTRVVPMEGLLAPFQWPLTDKRKAELARDRDWGMRNGIL